jgi:hypothetical protein
VGSDGASLKERDNTSHGWTAKDDTAAATGGDKATQTLVTRFPLHETSPLQSAASKEAGAVLAVAGRATRADAVTSLESEREERAGIDGQGRRGVNRVEDMVVEELRRLVGTLEKQLEAEAGVKSGLLRHVREMERRATNAEVERERLREATKRSEEELRRLREGKEQLEGERSKLVDDYGV